MACPPADRRDAVSAGLRAGNLPVVVIIMAFERGRDKGRICPLPSERICVPRNGRQPRMSGSARPLSPQISPRSGASVPKRRVRSASFTGVSPSTTEGSTAGFGRYRENGREDAVQHPPAPFVQQPYPPFIRGSRVQTSGRRSGFVYQGSAASTAAPIRKTVGSS